MKNIEKLLKEILENQIEMKSKQNSIEEDMQNLKNELKVLYKTISLHKSAYEKNINKLESIYDEIDFIKDKEIQNEKILYRLGKKFKEESTTAQ